MTLYPGLQPDPTAKHQHQYIRGIHPIRQEDARVKVTIVIGGGQGFGKAIAEKYIKEGANVVIADLSRNQGEDCQLNQLRLSRNQCDQSFGQRKSVGEDIACP